MSNEPQVAKTQARLIPLANWPEFHPWPNVPMFRYYIKHQDANGLLKHRVVKRVGKRILIDEAAFFRWVEAQQEEAD